MWPSIWKGALVGAIVAFVWSFVSWMVLPWHNTTLKGFTNEEFVGWTIKENARKHGVYILPHMEEPECKMTKEEKRCFWDQINQRRIEGPLVFAAVLPQGKSFAMFNLLITSFITYFVAAWLICFLLARSAISEYGRRVCFVTVIGLIAAILAFIPYWNWWSFPTKYIVVNMADFVITWLLVGLAISSLVKSEHKKRGKA